MLRKLLILFAGDRGVGNVHVSHHSESCSYPKHCMMPRRGAQPSRQQQAFESLLDQEYAAAHISSTGNNANRGRARGEKRGRQSKQALADKRDSDRLPGFALRDSLHSDHGACLPSPALEQLHSMFGNVTDKSGISAVFSECSNSVEAAIEVLLAMSERNQSQAPSKSSPAQSAKCEGTPVTAYTVSSIYQNPSLSPD